jgi:hypothetical protein
MCILKLQEGGSPLCNKSTFSIISNQLSISIKNQERSNRPWPKPFGNAR